MSRRIRICKCSRKPVDKVDFDINYKGKCCVSCGIKFKAIKPPLKGVRVQVEGGHYDDGYWMTLKDLKEALENA